MATKRKKKKKQVNPKVKEALRYKEFLEYILRVADACGGKELIHLLPKHILQEVFQVSFKPISVSSYHETDYISVKYHAIYKHMVHSGLRHFPVELSKNRPTITIYDYLMVGWALNYVLTDQIKKHPKEMKAIAEKFNPIVENDPTKMCLPFHSACHVISIIMSDITYCYNIIHLEPIVLCVPKVSLRFSAKLEFIDAQKRHYISDSKKRPIFRVGSSNVNCKFNWAKIKASDLKLRHVNPEKEFDVYIQNHALNRLKERIDCFDPPHISRNIYLNTLEPTVISRGKNTFLITYFIGTKRIGYLVCCIYQDMLVIKTFILLTQNGTPERNKLEHILHVKKYDFNFILLNKLSHFIASDIPEDRALYKIFEDCNCADLFHVSCNKESALCKELHHADLLREHIHRHGDNDNILGDDLLKTNEKEEW